MKKEYNILMVDDHPIILEGYQNILSTLANVGYCFNFRKAHDCDSALKELNDASKSVNFDVVFVDINLPSSSDGKLTSGEDVIKHARSLMPNAKVIVVTMLNKSHRLHNIIKTVEPDGFLIKSELTSCELIKAFKSALYAPPYYSDEVKECLPKTVQKDFIIDDANRKIIHHLSQGIKTKNVSKLVGLSISSIEKRKTQIKELFELGSTSDEKLIEEARNRGFAS